MKTKNPLFKYAAMAGALILLMPYSIIEAGRFRQCNGDPVILEGDPNTRISTISFPSGSTVRQDLDNVLDRWNSLQGMWLEFDPRTTFSGTYAFDKGRNEIALQNISSLGLTTTQFDACFWWFETQHIQEFDIEINPNTTWQFGVPPENTNDGNNSFRYTAVHELGHALGLLDNNNSAIASVMKQSLKGECWCSSSQSTRVHPLSDDTFSSRFLYPHSNTHRDIAACSFEVLSSNQNVIETMANTTITVRRGATFSVRSSFGNYGNRDENFDIIYVLSTNAIISTSDRIVASGTGSAPSGAWHTFTWDAQVPSNLAPGTYSLGLIIDPNNTIPEKIESNNMVLLRTTVRVI
ncbi:MAG: hypothetical protein C0490_01050 [Marivirga sp.]|nr:hypothetical protein [Marivirga sp.]